MLKTKNTGKYKLTEETKEILKQSGSHLDTVGQVKGVHFTSVIRWLKSDDSALNDLAVIEAIEKITGTPSSQFLIPNPAYETK